MVFCNPKKGLRDLKKIVSHNPYFSRWFSAIILRLNILRQKTGVTILILVDGFLQ